MTEARGGDFAYGSCDYDRKQDFYGYDRGAVCDWAIFADRVAISSGVDLQPETGGNAQAIERNGATGVRTVADCRCIGTDRKSSGRSSD